MISSLVVLHLSTVQLQQFQALTLRDLKDSSLIKRNNRVPSQTALVFIGFCFVPLQHLLPTMSFLLWPLFFHLI